MKTTKAQRRITHKKYLMPGFVMAGLLSALACGYGYAAQSTSLLIEGAGRVSAHSDVYNKSVQVIYQDDNALEGYNAEYSTFSASLYPQISTKGQKMTYAITTCNSSKTKTYELTGLDEPATAIGSMDSEIANVEVGTRLVLGTKLGPGECVDTEVTFGQWGKNTEIGSMTLDYTWSEYNGTPFSIDYMQDMTPEVCAATTERETKQLEDKRDGNKYWVTKMHDGNCWMVQDLDYDGGGTKIAYDDLATTWDADRTSSPAQYLHTDDNENGHESDGSYYSYAAAMSVCPSGWRLGTGGTGSEWDVLLDVPELSSISDWNEWYEAAGQAPFYLRMTGYAGKKKGLYSHGTSRTGWTSTRSTEQTASAYSIGFGSDYPESKYTVTWSDYMHYGEPVRCVAKTGKEPANEKTIWDIEKMQEMTVAVCDNTILYDTKQLIDERDGKKYWVTKLEDGQCWMTQNLDYDGGGTKFDASSDITQWISEEHSNPAQYYYNGDNDLGRDSDGSYYSYAAAISVCPTGWRLPIGGPGGDTDNIFSGNKLGSSASARSSAIRKAPYYFWLSGYVDNRGFLSYNKEGAYRLARTEAEPVMTIFDFTPTAFSVYGSNDERYYGESVRCVYGEPAQEPTDITTIETMQELTPALCARTGVYDEDARRRLTDTRDGHKYWVSKLSKDGNCWMVQNLDYDGGGDVRFDDSTDTANWDTTKTGNPSQYYYRGDWDDQSGSLGPLGSWGSLYSYAAAQNVCPKNWRLPTGGENGEQAALWSGLSLANLRAAPYYHVYSGWYDNRATQAGGRQGYWWSSTDGSTAGYAWTTYFNSSGGVRQQYEDYKYFGFSVRCMMSGN